MVQKDTEVTKRHSKLIMAWEKTEDDEKTNKFTKYSATRPPSPHQKLVAPVMFLLTQNGDCGIEGHLCLPLTVNKPIP